ncbi:MAG: hydantoinase B/oxoprolinase family protein, partial [Planctomycetes bacterium]|nr:hydantoinase B/oxoprolinase family protein [Planctomycetota bacterium]
MPRRGLLALTLLLWASVVSAGAPFQAIGPVELEVCWNRLVSIASEQAATMVNSAFSVVLGEMEDLSAGVFDRRGVMLAQSVQGAPGHLGSLGIGVKHFVAAFDAGSLAPGDVLITNDPWLVSGHKHDITVVIPVFLGRRLVGFTASNCHAVDIGGRIFSATAETVYEEGLHIPMMKLFDAGRRNETLFRLIETNVRSPELVLGDLMAQVSANQVAGERM